ncbi:hypothetical protein SAMN05446037_101447 [Anaerovirgula multivorans]|uniref:Uncharacterized protein n=1 Tax=Anaerovirgula multivorans TaxID=312168 RepID=A0A239FUP7_9FIRM|nr:hypothetical protein [Anaerovirgula multivorans]SNS60515.1 hypothetical protein SAMN05446037_101447 [Anaerovirgula multivorans]
MANPLTKVVMSNIAHKSLKREECREKTSVSLQKKEEDLLINLIHKNKKNENLRDKGFSTNDNEELQIVTLSELAAKTGKLQREESEEDKGRERKGFY